MENACHLSKSPIKLYRNYKVHVHNLHPDANLQTGANKFARTKLQILKTLFTWPKIHTRCCTPCANCAHERGFKDRRP